MDFEKMNCSICDRNTFSKIARLSSFDKQISTKFDLVRCDNCRHVMINPQPTEEFLEGFYNRYYSKESKGIHGEIARQRRIQANLHKQLYSILKDSHNILDYGCGCGAFLSFCNMNGFSCHGADFSSKILEDLRQVTKHELYSIEEFLDSNKCYDAITMLDVLEHTKNPRKVLTEVKTHIKHNGILIVKVPNYNCTAMQLIATHNTEQFRQSAHLNPPEHLQYFRPNIIKKLLESCGYSNIRILASKNIFHNKTSDITKYIYTVAAHLIKAVSFHQILIYPSILCVANK